MKKQRLRWATKYSVWTEEVWVCDILWWDSFYCPGWAFVCEAYWIVCETSRKKMLRVLFSIHGLGNLIPITGMMNPDFWLWKGESFRCCKTFPTRKCKLSNKILLYATNAKVMAVFKKHRVHILDWPWKITSLNVKWTTGLKCQSLSKGFREWIICWKLMLFLSHQSLMMKAWNLRVKNL